MTPICSVGACIVIYVWREWGRW